MVRAVRGATTVVNNDAEEILEATREMLSELEQRNGINKEDLIDIVFTVTPDLTKVFPARAARQLGYTDIPLLDMQSPDIEGALEMCIRTIVHLNTEKKNSDMKHVYLRGAKVLRPDIVNNEVKN
ncbi:MAG: chorismate mutase [bacterium]|nr:chorismate mutase [bacterium]